MRTQVPQRAGFNGPTLVRLLAHLTDATVPVSRQPLSERLSQWLGWTDAIALSTILNERPRQAAPDSPPTATDAEKDYGQVRASLAKAIAEDSALSPPKRPARPLPSMHRQAVASDTDFILYRQHYAALQRSMDSAIGSLRLRVRSQLAARTPDMARLAALDSVMEQAMATRERQLLAAIPALLEPHFMRLRQAQDTPPTDGVQASTDTPLLNPDAPRAWLERFRHDMRSALLAELDVRLQPVQALLAALHTSEPESHDQIPA